jgi:hypothetical protein
MNFNLDFYPQAKVPIVHGEYLLYNQCDGYHQAAARFDEAGTFIGFFSFMGHEYEPDTYQAFARLPDTQCLYELFGVKTGNDQGEFPVPDLCVTPVSTTTR